MNKTQTTAGSDVVAGLQTMEQADKAQHQTTVVDVVDKEALAAAESLK